MKCPNCAKFSSLECLHGSLSSGVICTIVSSVAFTCCICIFSSGPTVYNRNIKHRLPEEARRPSVDFDKLYPTGCRHTFEGLPCCLACMRDFTCTLSPTGDGRLTREMRTCHHVVIERCAIDFSKEAYCLVWTLAWSGLS